jgi:hypothetical protein
MLQTRLAPFIALALVTTGAADAHCRRAALTAGLDTLRPTLASAARTAAPFEPELGAEPAGTGAPVQAKSASSAPKPETSSSTPTAARSATPPSDPAPAAPLPPSDVPSPYTVAPGETLRAVLTRWTAASGWQLVWEAPNDYTLSATASFPGSLEQAATRLMEAVHSAGAPFGARMAYGNRVLRVTRVR